MELVSVDQLQDVAPLAPSATLAAMLRPLNESLIEFKINTESRIAAFLAQIAHESGQFRWLTEHWGPTSDQMKYEPPARKALRLGNVHAGDGFKYRGRGFIQLTGRSNYRKFGKLAGIDLEAHPDRASEIPIACKLAALYWTDKKLNPLADKNDFRGITRRINGGFNGYQDRVEIWERAKEIIKRSNIVSAPDPQTGAAKV